MKNETDEAARPPFQKCDGRAVICSTLDRRLGNSYSKGLVLQPVINLKTGADCDPILLYKTSTRDRGLILNLCPWCGQKLNRGYQKPGSRKSQGERLRAAGKEGVL